MKLIKEIIQRRLDIMKDLELNNEDIKAIWHFYQVYKLSMNFLGIQDMDIKNKDRLVSRLIRNPDNISLLIKLKRFMAQDNRTIQFVLDSIDEVQEESEILEDFYPMNIFAVNIYDR